MVSSRRARCGRRRCSPRTTVSHRLTVVLDANGSQVDGPISSVTTIEPIAAKWEAFGWEVLEVDGHDVGALSDALRSADVATRPAIVVARTDIFGRLSCFPDTVDGHFVKLDDELREAIAAEIQQAV